jgi:hypothetical protein
MGHPVLRLYDGYDHTSPQLREEVRGLQEGLRKRGLLSGADGYFGPGTEEAVKGFQRANGLYDDGVVGPLTWAALLGTRPPDPAGTFWTTYAKEDASLLGQLKEAKKYRTLIDEAATGYSIPPCLIGGIGSRESNWGLILKPKGPAGTGDFIKRGPRGDRTRPLPPDGGGFGRGLMQVDYDAHPFAQGEDWKDPGKNIMYGCKVLADSRAFIQRKTGLQGKELLRAALAAYNCGPGNALAAIRDALDVDFYTAGRDYSRDVLSRAGWFQLQGWP